MTKLETIQKYFDSRATSNLETMLDIFDPNIKIYNVYFPVFEGSTGVERYCNDFKNRIAKCTFDIIDVLEKENITMVEWRGKLTYRNGAVAGNTKIEEEFAFELRGINRFDFKGDKIETLRIYHETTTATNLVKTHGKIIQ